MSTLADIRDRLRLELHDVAPQRWSDESLERHIAHALEELSIAMPRLLVADIPTTAGSYDVPLVSLAGLIDVERIEYPLASPANVIGFERWGDTLSIEPSAPLPAGDDIRVRYTARHMLDAEASTLSPFQEELVTLGASGLAAEELAAAAIDTLSTGGQRVPGEFRAWGQARLIAFRQLLHQYRRPGPLRPRMLVRH